MLKWDPIDTLYLRFSPFRYLYQRWTEWQRAAAKRRKDAKWRKDWQVKYFRAGGGIR